MEIKELVISDTFGQLFGPAGEQIIGTFKDEGKTLSEVRKHFMQSLLFSLDPLRTNFIASQDSLNHKIFLPTNKLWNVFVSNPTALATGASVLSVLSDGNGENRIQSLHPRQVLSMAIPLSIAFLAEEMESFPTEFSNLADSTQTNEAEFTRIVGNLEERMKNDDTRKMANGIDNLIEALMFLRERRVEEVPLTFDIGIGINGLWETFSETSDDEWGTTSSSAKVANNRLKKLSDISTEVLVKEVEDASKHYGRGVASLRLEDGPGSDVKIIADKIWPSHENAPLSTLYGFNWRPPSVSTDSGNEVHLVLLPSGVVSIQAGSEPIFEYFAGSWRYVDPYHKSKILSEYLTKRESKFQSKEDEGASDPIYRVGRLAYQLSYHNHGATIELIFGNPTFSKDGKLAMASKRRTDIDRSNDDWRKIRVPDKEENIEETEHIGRWVYQLSVSDGITTLYCDEHHDLSIGDFGQIVKFDTKKCDKKWERLLKNTMSRSVNLPKLGGARHHSAFQRVLDDAEDGIGKVVFCVSQDGYIDIYTKDDWMRMR